MTLLTWLQYVASVEAVVVVVGGGVELRPASEGVETVIGRARGGRTALPFWTGALHRLQYDLNTPSALFPLLSTRPSCFKFTACS